MRLQDFTDFMKLRRIAHNPAEIIRFRKAQHDGEICVVRFRDGTTFDIRGARQDFNIFLCVFLRDEYRLNPLDGSHWSCAIDIGGNIGAFAVRAARLARRVICYEPVADNFCQLEKNSRKLSNIETVQQAVAGQAGDIRLYCPNEPRDTGRYSMFHETRNHLSDEYRTIEAVTLNDVFDRHKVESCDLLKLDVEGAEYDILYNATPQTLARIDRIHAEYHNVDPADPRTRITALTDYLREHGFATETVPQRKRVNKGLLFAQRTAGR